MKSKILYSLLLFIITTKMHGQVYDTIVVYDTILVYDTVIVYDTIKISDNFFNLNGSTQHAVLELDTAASKAQLIIFNEKDTATIPINSIIVSDTNNNSQTMKKLNLTLAASALLTQMLSAHSMQESKVDTLLKNTDPKYAISIGGSYVNLWVIGGGGNFKLEYLKTNKLGLGLKVNATTYKLMQQFLWNIGDIGGKFNPGFYLVSDLTASYYLIGDYFHSKAGMNAGLGIGYQFENLSSTVQYKDDPLTYKHSFIANGLGGHASLGGSYKLGSGKIYLEVIAGAIIYGTVTHIIPFKKHSPISEEVYYHYSKQRQVGIEWGFMSWNLGYTFYF